jgi:F0F1-type ATP synthase assembly protein I
MDAHGMNDPVSRGKRLVSRFAALQFAAAVVAAVGAGMWSGGPAAQAALAGGAVVATGNLLFGWRLFAPGIAAAPRIARAMWVGEGLKWLWVVLAVWLALGVVDLAPSPFLIGMLAAQAGFWIGVAILR